MTDYDKLAQRIVALGVGYIETDDVFPSDYYVNLWEYDQSINELSAESFCNDWRVVGALMEKYKHGVIYCSINSGWFATPKKGGPWFRNSSLPIAIAEACCDALEGTDD